ncbi:hypothetical protein RB195_018166 [Necator americanus]|uniref:RNase H type-1 domain-containing protein n=1 Tax=Necator americanus TaxID=51031 RepID=A0ABR1C8H3_NECAM
MTSVLRYSYCWRWNPLTMRAAARPLLQFRRRPQLIILTEYSYSQSTASQSTHDVREVCTTGYSFKTAAGRVSKYGVYWGRDNPNNSICEIPGITHVAAMLMAMIDAVRVAKKDDNGQKLVVYTDFNCPPGFRNKLKTYAARDFHSFSGWKMKNAVLLKELYELTKDMNVSFRHRPAVMDRKPNYVMANILEDDADGRTPSTSSEDWPNVYTMAMFKSTRNGFTAASFATVWSDKRYGCDTMQRLAMVPATLFRAQLAAIEEALKQAVDNCLPRIVVVTDSQVFILSWRNGWLKANGSPVSNKFLYDRIRDLVHAGTEVRFRYQTPEKDSVEWSSAIDKCFESIDLPIVGKDRSEYNRDISELLVEKNSLDDSCMQKVRIFKNGTNFHSGFVWESNGKFHENVVRVEKRVYHYLLDVLEKASSLGLHDLVIRTDSVRLVLSAENWLPIWHRNGWRNSLHKPIADSDIWKRIWSLKRTVKVYWELMDPPDDSDREAAKHLSPKEKTP